jgi:hypothetical protein
MSTDPPLIELFNSHRAELPDRGEVRLATVRNENIYGLRNLMRMLGL